MHDHAFEINLDHIISLTDFDNDSLTSEIKL